MAVLAAVLAVMAIACMTAGATALTAASSMGAGRPFLRYLLTGLGMLAVVLLAGGRLRPMIGQPLVWVAAVVALGVVAWSALEARWHGGNAPGLLPSARRLSRLGSRLVMIGVGLAVASFLLWLGLELPVLR